MVELHTAQWDRASGWLEPLPDLDGRDTLVLAFGGASMLDDAAPLADVAAAYPTSHVMGCSTAGEIRDDLVHDDTLTLVVARFATTRLTLVGESVSDARESRAVGCSLGARLIEADPQCRAALVLSDGLGVNGTELVAGLTAGTGSQVLISGGLAGDGPRFERTWVLVDGVPRVGYVTALGLAGDDLVVSHGSRGGWDIFGPERLITKSDGNVLYELDGQPALELYKKYLGDRAVGLPATGLLFPLAVRASGESGRSLTRTILAVDEATQSMTFAGDMPQGALAQLMRASFDRLVDGAYDAASDADGMPEGPTLALAVSCVGRRLLLGARTEDELEAALSALPPGTVQIGFYSYGEISPGVAGTCDLHNQTMTITTFGERG